ncbi:MAG: helix-turn-helix transcriptional regulator [Cyanobacteria bacterium HKST-UBA06]|nr:helix-turn-helix transcriptional regulator [Cyanobacteria bacterium HKST-UBA04]MCA9806651.1 helix-turn-helix transcriptional regulator [Cyanobacteria bacterium HKST-UBA06]
MGVVASKPIPLPESPIGCPVDSLLRLITGQWTLYLMWRLHHEGPKRFGQLKRDLGGISAKVLTERLRMLEEYDLVQRDVKPTRPPEVTYTLTQRARELLEIMSPLYQLACKWAKEAEWDR